MTKQKEGEGIYNMGKVMQNLFHLANRGRGLAFSTHLKQLGIKFKPNQLLLIGYLNAIRMRIVLPQNSYLLP